MICKTGSIIRSTVGIALLVVAVALYCGCANSQLSPEAPSHSVTLSWAPSSSPDVAGYYVYRGMTAKGPFEKLNSDPTRDTTYTDTAVVSGTTYYYVVTAVDSSGNESGYSNVAEATVP